MPGSTVIPALASRGRDPIAPVDGAASGNVGPVGPSLGGAGRAPYECAWASDQGVVMAREGLRVREVSEVEGDRPLRIVRRSSGSVVTWRRAQRLPLGVSSA